MGGQCGFESGVFEAEVEGDLAAFAHRRDGGFEPVAEGDRLAGLQAPGRAGEGTPSTFGQAPVQRRLDPRPAPVAGQPRGYHPGIVDDQQVAGAKLAGQVSHLPVPQTAGRNAEHARRVARYGGPPRYSFVGQREIEQRYPHGASGAGATRRPPRPACERSCPGRPPVRRA